MARLPRLYVPDLPQLVLYPAITPIALNRDDELFFLKCLDDAAITTGVKVHAYALTPYELQLLVTPGSELALGLMMQGLGRTYVGHFNRKYGRSGTIWTGRYKAAVIQPDPYFLDAMISIDRALENGGNLLTSYAARHGGESLVKLTDHPEMACLKDDNRVEAYPGHNDLTQVFNTFTKMRHFVIKNWAFGTSEWKASIQEQANRRLTQSKRGRPPGRKNTPQEKEQPHVNQ
jgi:putative transposase